jgi:hypothetical protein
MMLVLQSVIAVADVHQFHQQKRLHESLTIDESTDTKAANSDVSQNDRSASVDQCTHCCHCHGSMSALSGHAPYLPDFDRVASFSDHSLFNKSWLTSPDLRPPIV